MLHLFVRSMTMAAIGVLLLMFREQAMPFIVMCIGVLFFLPALFTLAYILIPLFKHGENISSITKVVPIMAVGSLLLGCWMFFHPEFFVKIIMWVLGGIMVLVGGMQLLSLIIAKRKAFVSSIFFLLPLSILLSGIVVLINPFEVASIPFIILGVGAIVAALSDIINTIFLKYYRKNEDMFSANDDIGSYNPD